jgi:hypothetical protein
MYSDWSEGFLTVWLCKRFQTILYELHRDKVDKSKKQIY